MSLLASTEMETVIQIDGDFFCKIRITAHSLSISGGTENIRYYASVGYTDEHGNTKGEENKRYTAMTRLNLNYNKFSMNFGLNASIMKKDYTPEQVGVADYAYNTARSLKAYNEDGTPWFYQRDYHGAYDRSSIYLTK